MPLLEHVTGSKQRQFLTPLLYFDKFFVPPLSLKHIFFVPLPSLKHMSERQRGYIYRPVPPLSTQAPSLLPAPSFPQHIYMCCRKDIFLSEGYILVGKIYPCPKDISLHNITLDLSPLVQHKISFLRQ